MLFALADTRPKSSASLDEHVERAFSLLCFGIDDNAMCDLTVRCNVTDKYICQKVCMVEM